MLASILHCLPGMNRPHSRSINKQTKTVSQKNSKTAKQQKPTTSGAENPSAAPEKEPRRILFGFSTRWHSTERTGERGWSVDDDGVAAWLYGGLVDCSAVGYDDLPDFTLSKQASALYGTEAALIS